MQADLKKKLRINIWTIIFLCSNLFISKNEKYKQIY